jgi:hypothetical protein
MASENNKGKKGTSRLRPVWVVLIALVVLVAGVIVVVNLPRGSVQTADVSVIGMDTQIQTIEETVAVEQTTVKIDMESCSGVVGTKFIVTATVTPANTEKALQWKSNDDKIMKVSSDGIVEITGVGTAALTATVGDVSDSIIVEGLADDEAKSSLNLPNVADAGSAAGAPTEADGGDGTGNGDSSVTASEDADATQAATQPVATTPTVAATAAPTVKATEAVVSNGLRSYDLPEVLVGYGYESNGANVYTYGEADSYAGEVIVQPNLVIIYIKKATEDFSSSIQDVLEDLLPDEHAQAWNNYTMATTDRTFTLEGRTVRIVTAGNGGHSQIVVYN